jgi:hypothetical protein
MKNADYIPRLIFCEVTKECNLRGAFPVAPPLENSHHPWTGLQALNLIKQASRPIPPFPVLSDGEPLFGHDIFDLEH